MQFLSYNNYDIYIITNQPGVSRGVMSEEDLSVIHEKLRAELQGYNKHIRISGIYYCPHGWVRGVYAESQKPDCFFRPPETII